MKSFNIKNKISTKVLLLNIILILCFINNINSDNQSNTPSMFANNGEDWLGLCATGIRQSPVNIIEGLNTKEDLSTKITVKYVSNTLSNNKRFYFDGTRLYLSAPLGKLTLSYPLENQTITEIYSADRLEIKIPSEHYITINGFTPRYAIEIQIHHNLESTSNSKVTNRDGTIKSLSLNIPMDYSELPNAFLKTMGIREENKLPNGEFNVIPPGQELQYPQVMVSTYNPVIQGEALNLLNNMINEDPTVYLYFGSETLPPCNEDTLHVVFRKPRTLSSNQFNWLRKQLVRKLDGSPFDNSVFSRYEVFGVKRNIKPYDVNMRGEIKLLPNGLSNPYN